MNDVEKNRAALMAAIKNGKIEINGRDYQLTKMPFKQAKKVFAYLTTIADELDSGKLGFIDTDKFESEIEPLLMKYTMFDGFKLDTIDGHFDDYPSDYVQFVTATMQGFAAPFIPEPPTGSTSQQKGESENTLKKPM